MCCKSKLARDLVICSCNLHCISFQHCHVNDCNYALQKKSINVKYYSLFFSINWYRNPLYIWNDLYRFINHKTSERSLDMFSSIFKLKKIFCKARIVKDWYKYIHIPTKIFYKDLTRSQSGYSDEELTWM